MLIAISLLAGFLAIITLFVVLGVPQIAARLGRIADSLETIAALMKEARNDIPEAR